MSTSPPQNGHAAFDSLPKLSQPPDEVFDAARAGDAEAVGAIVENYRYLVKWVASRWFVPGFEFEDIEQEGFVCLLESLQPFNPSKAKFSTYFITSFHHRLSDRVSQGDLLRIPRKYSGPNSTIQRARESARHVASLDYVGSSRGMEDALATRACPQLGPADAMMANEDRDAAKIEIERRIADLRLIPDARQRDIVLRRLFGAEFPEIAAHYGVSRQRAWQLFQKGLEYLPNADDYGLRLSRFPVGWLPDEDVARLRLGITNDLDMAVVENCKRFVVIWTYWLKNRMAPFDIQGAIQSGMLAVIEAVRDGEIDAQGVMSRGAKRRVRRHIINAIRATIKSSKASRPPIADFGYEDGRTLREHDLKPPKDKYVRYRRRNIEAGLCPRCGRKPERFKLCNRCRDKSNHCRRLAAKAEPFRPPFLTEHDKMAIAGMR